MDNIAIKLLWIDGLLQEDLMTTIGVTASSAQSSAYQKCDLDTVCMSKLGELMVRHSFEFDTKHSFTIDDRFCVTKPLSIVMHEADVTGRAPIELVFHLDDKAVGLYSATVVVRAELGRLETLGKRLAGLRRKGVGAVCELYPAEL